MALIWRASRRSTRATAEFELIFDEVPVEDVGEASFERASGFGGGVRFDPVDRAWLASLLHPLPRLTLRRLRRLVQPDTILKWHRDLIARRHAAVSRPRRRGRPRTLRLIRTLVLRLVVLC